MKTKCNCEIQWVDDDGKPTPDNNKAIGIVQCLGYDLKTSAAYAVNPSYKPEPSALYPICAEHLKQMPNDGVWVFTPFK